MDAAELGDWRTFEAAYGPLLVHERVDYGLAMVAFTVARALGSKRATYKRFLPPWLRQQAAEAGVRGLVDRLRGMVGQEFED